MSYSYNYGNGSRPIICAAKENAMAAALPAHFKLSSETVLIFNEEYGDDFSELDHDEYIIAEALLVKKEISISRGQQLLDNPHAYPVIKRLIEKNCVLYGKH